MSLIIGDLNMEAINVLSLFDGISCGQVALERAGIPIRNYYASEIEENCIKITQKNHPETIQLGDVRSIDLLKFTQIPSNEYVIDLLIGGSPCQDLSIAGTRQGLDGSRSCLFWEYVRALKIVKPKWFLFENVASMKKEDKDIITNALGVEPIMINSALVSAQTRKRLYWTNIPHVEQPEDRHIYLKDILKSGVAPQNKSYCLTETYHKACLSDFVKKHTRTMIGEPLKIPEATKKGFAEIQQGECVDLTQLNSKTRRGRAMKEKSNCVTASNIQYYQYLGKAPIRLGHLEGRSNAQANRVYSIEGKSVCLNANGGGGGAKTGLYKIDLPDGEYIIRKLTPVECERLQTLPDNYTEGIPNSSRYKAIGNGWTVEVIAHILKGIKEDGELQK